MQSCCKACRYNWGRAATHVSPLTPPLQDLNIHETLNAFISSVIIAGLEKTREGRETKRRERAALFKQESARRCQRVLIGLSSHGPQERRGLNLTAVHPWLPSPHSVVVHQLCGLREQHDDRVERMSDAVESVHQRPAQVWIPLLTSVAAASRAVQFGS